ncbi:MAG TPA: DUF6515 family protein [Candidatus Eremiobacteraceae bacterium]|nr:DUF6515 family protein [Candidatus Eremiobacteraceae bacterium]
MNTRIINRLVIGLAAIAFVWVGCGGIASAFRGGGGGGGFRGGGGGFHSGGYSDFNRGGFGGDFRGQGSVSGARDASFDRPSSGSASHNAQNWQQSKAPDDAGSHTNVSSNESQRQNAVSTNETNRQSSASNLSAQRTNEAQSFYNNDDWHGGYYGGGWGCCGPDYSGWGWGVAGLATGLVIGSAVTAAEMPANYTTVYVNNTPYAYYGGTFYQQSGTNYTVVAPPTGATVSQLPPQYTTVYAQGDSTPYYYFSGYYYTKTSSGYQIVSPPKGIIVPYLPKGYTQTSDNGVAQYHFAGLTYVPYYQGGEVVYQLT